MPGSRGPHVGLPIVPHLSAMHRARCLRPASTIAHRIGRANPKPFRIPGGTGKHAVPLTLWEGPSVPSLSGHCAANEEPSPPGDGFLPSGHEMGGTAAVRTGSEYGQRLTRLRLGLDQRP